MKSPLYTLAALAELSRRCIGPATQLFSFWLLLVFLFLDPPAVGAQTLPAGFSTTLVGSGWNQPVGMCFSSDGKRLFVWEKAGLVWLMNWDATAQTYLKPSTPLLDISQEVGNWRDHGLLGFALDPNFETNRYLYVLYVVDRHHLTTFGTPDYRPATNDYSKATIGRLTRYQASLADHFGTVASHSRKVLLGESITTGIPILYTTHGVGSLVFGTDGTLLVTCGDGASAATLDTGNAATSYYAQALSDGIIAPNQNVGAMRAQQIQSLSGKILRLDPATGDGVESNPYFDAANPRAPQSRVWALGVRNPCRMSIKPNTGSHSAADANPGTLYLGDVGWSNWEEMNVVHSAGMNLGWPLYEGLEANVSYTSKPIPNREAPNPVFKQGTCTQPYFSFNDLLKQQTLDGNPAFPNPCNSAYSVPASIPHFMHARPVLDWKHDTTATARTGIFSGNQAAVIKVGGAGSPVSGTSFKGGCSIGGVWYTGSNFPAEYKNTYFHADYATGWIRNFVFTTNDQPTQVKAFASRAGGVVSMAQHPTDGTLWYVSLSSSSLIKLSYTANRAPVAQASVDRSYGATPLTVQLTGSQSYDAEGDAFTYRWNFGDGSSQSTEANPSHTFLAATGVATRYVVTLTVANSHGASAKTLLISVNNTPPVVRITSPVNNTQYAMNNSTVYNLTARVSDAEQAASGLTYQWQTIMHHNQHEHAEPYDNHVSTTSELSPLGCDGDTYYYRLVLTVTDAAGLSTTQQVRLYPNCEPPRVSITAPVNGASFTAGSSITVSATASDANGSISQVAFFRGTTSLGVDNTAPYSVVFANAPAGSYALTAKATDNGGATTTSSAVNIRVSPPCTASGTILREVWSNLPTGSNTVSSIPLTTAPSSSSQLTLFESPTNSGDNYGERLRGYLCVPVSGNYTFWIACDNDGELWLSTNDQAASKRRIASVAGYTSVQQWTKYSSQQSAPIALVAGQRYYIEALHRESSGGDNLAVGWQLPNDTLERPIPGSRLSLAGGASPANTPPTVSLTAPTNGATFTAGSSITVSATASDANGSISQVAFFRGTTSLGVDNSAPYSVVFANAPAGSYALTAKATDNGGATTTSSAVNIRVSPPCTASGTILRELWSNLPTGSNAVSSIPLTTAPSSSSQLTLFESPTNSGDNYGERLRGYLCVPISGNYTFWIACDNDGELWLSTNDQAASKRRIATVTGYTSVQQWTKYGSQQSAPIALVAGQRYYIEALHRESSGGDNLSVGWQLPNGTLERPIPGTRLSALVAATARLETSAESLVAEPSLTLTVQPNPFSDRTTVRFTSNRSERAVLELYDLRGMRLREVFQGAVLAGEAITVEVDGTGLAQGLYLLRLKTTSQATHQRLLLQR